MRRLDVLWASEALVPAAGGAERATLEWLGALVARGHRARAVCVQGDPAPEAMPVPDGVAVTAVPPPRATGYWEGKRARRDVIGGAVTRAIEQRRPDVVAGQLHAGPGAVEAAAEAGVPKVLVIRSYEALCRNAFDPESDCAEAHDCASCPQAEALSADERASLLDVRAGHERALESADAILANSHAVARAVERWCGRSSHVVRNAMTPPGEARAAFEGHVVLAANRWAPHKGARLLVSLTDAVRRPRISAARRAVRITRRGLGPELEAALSAAGAELVANAPLGELIEGASLLLMPSQWEEPFGRVAWEAMAAGVPVLAARSGGLTEFVPETLLVALRDDPRAWAGALERVLGDRQAWSRARAEGRRGAHAMLEPPPVDALESALLSLVAVA